MTHDGEAAAERVLRTIGEQAVITVAGTRLEAGLESACVQSDTPGALAMARGLRTRLDAAGFQVVPMREVIGAGTGKTDLAERP